MTDTSIEDKVEKYGRKLVEAMAAETVALAELERAKQRVTNAAGDRAAVEHDFKYWVKLARAT